MRITVPRGACDTHIHFYDEKVPGAPGTFLPGNFTVKVNAIKELGKGAKGVAVVKPGVKDAELERLTKAGICAIRIMTLHGGTLGFDVMDELMARVDPFGWHANIQLDGRELPKHEA